MDYRLYAPQEIVTEYDRPRPTQRAVNVCFIQDCVGVRALAVTTVDVSIRTPTHKKNLE